MRPIAVFPLKCRNAANSIELWVLAGERFALAVNGTGGGGPEAGIASEDNADGGISPDAGGSVYAKFVRFAVIRAMAIRGDRFFCGDGVRLDGGDRGVVYLVWKGLKGIHTPPAFADTASERQTPSPACSSCPHTPQSGGPPAD